MTSPIARLAVALESRLGRNAARPSLWGGSFGALVGHIAVACVGVLLVTGIVLALFHDPSVEPVAYTGSSALYQGRELPAAYASILEAEERPGGLLLRRMHSAAAHLLAAMVILHMWWALMTGAARAPRRTNHLVGMIALLLVVGAFFTGTLLGFDLVAGASLRIGYAVLDSTPVVGEQLALLVFDGSPEAGRLVPRAFVLHAYVLPGLMLAATGLHLWLVHRQTPTSHPGGSEETMQGMPLWPDMALRHLALVGIVIVTTGLSSLLVPWSDSQLLGPVLAGEAPNTLHPPWPLFFMSGGLRLLPPVDLTILGVHVSGVLLAGAVLPAVALGLLAAYPFIESWARKDAGWHHVRDGVLDVPFRVGALAALASGFLILSLAAAVDILAFQLSVPVEWVVRVLRAGVVAGPPLAFVLGRRFARRQSNWHSTPTGM